MGRPPATGYQGTATGTNYALSSRGLSGTVAGGLGLTDILACGRGVRTSAEQAFETRSASMERNISPRSQTHAGPAIFFATPKRQDGQAARLSAAIVFLVLRSRSVSRTQDGTQLLAALLPNCTISSGVPVEGVRGRTL